MKDTGWLLEEVKTCLDATIDVDVMRVRGVTYIITHDTKLCLGTILVDSDEVRLYIRDPDFWKKVSIGGLFENPLAPTESELTLFQIEHGYEYPMKKYLKEVVSG